MLNEVHRWVVLELTSKAENEDPDLIRASIRHHIRNAEVFIPASVVQRGEQKVYHYLVDGYAFILDQYPESYYARLVDTKYVQGPLYVVMGKKEKQLATISLEQVEQLRKQIKVEVDQGIEVDDIVTITSGPYKNISAVVREEIKEHDAVVIHIQLRSTDRLVTLPRAFLKLKSKPPHVVYKARLNAIAEWAKMAIQLARWNQSFDGVRQKYRSFMQLDSLIRRSQVKFFLIRMYYTKFEFTPLWNKFQDLQRLQLGALLKNRIRVVAAPLSDLKKIRSKYQKVVYLTNTCDKIVRAYLNVKDMTEHRPINLIVDGTQLFIRCLSAPGLDTLADAQGRSTGAIVGFLRSLGAYKKRFPEAQIHVCWDGSSRRRRALFPEYKANRISRSEEPRNVFEMDWLRQNLPVFGVSQMFNLKEEADDVIASLVWGPFLHYPNVIISTDRDLLQLVTEFTHQLCPKVGLGKEKLYTPNSIKLEYGVPPEAMVHVKALSGDTSDNIPGVPGFGLKTASKLIKYYGTVTSLLESNLAGLSKGQVTKLRENEERVKKNIDLVVLKDVPFEKIKPSPDQKEAKVRLEELRIKADPILTSFFPQQQQLLESETLT